MDFLVKINVKKMFCLMRYKSLMFRFNLVGLGYHYLGEYLNRLISDPHI